MLVHNKIFPKPFFQKIILYKIVQKSQIIYQEVFYIFLNARTCPDVFGEQLHGWKWN